MSNDPERYVTIAELRDELAVRPEAYGLSDTDEDGDGTTEYEEALERFLGAETDRIESEAYAGTKFVETTTSATVFEAEAVRGRDGRDLVLPERPIASVSSIVLEDVDETLTVDDVRVRETHLELLEENSADLRAWPEGAITVEYTFGYSSAPAPVVEAIVRLVRNRLDRIDSDGVDSESVAGQSVTYTPPGKLRADVRSSVGQYRPDSYDGGGAMVV